MNEGSGDRIYDLSGNGYTGVFGATAPNWTTGKFGPATEFVRANTDYIDLSSVVLPLPKTIVVWAYLANSSNEQQILSYAKTTNWRVAICVDSTNFMGVQVWDGAAYVDASIAFSAGWHQLVFTGDGSTGASVKGYVDGVQVGDTAMFVGLSAGNDLCKIGSNVSVNGDFFDGKVDHVIIYDRELNASEIADLYSDPFRFMVDDDDYLPLWYAALPTAVTWLSQVRHGDQKPMLGVNPNWGKSINSTLVGSYPFNEDSGDRVYDLSGNDNTGTFVSAVTWVPEGLAFAGDDDYIDVGTKYGFTTEDFTIMCKFRHDADAPDMLFCNGIDSQYGIIFQVGNTGKYLISINQAAATQVIKSQDNVYTVGVDATVAFVRDKTVGRIYHNGQEVSSYATQDALIDPVVPSASTRFGINVNGLAYDFTGQMYWMYIFDSALSADEIEQIHNENYVSFDYEIWYTTEEAAAAGILVPYYYFSGAN
jgi:hypothetical protein